MSSIIGPQCLTFKTLLKDLTQPFLYIHFIDRNFTKLLCLIIQQTFQVISTIATVPSEVKKSCSNPLGERIPTTQKTPILEPTELLKDFYIKPFPTFNITLKPSSCVQKNFITHWNIGRTKIEKDLKKK